MRTLPFACAIALMATSAAQLKADEPASTVQSLPGAYTFEQIHAALTKMGYEFHSVTPDKSQCIIITDHGDLTMYILVTVNVEQQWVWFAATLAEVQNPDNLSASVLQKMLEENDKISPAFFQYNSKFKRISLQNKLDNRDWTTARLRREIESFDEIARSSRPLWSEVNLEHKIPSPPETSLNELSRFKGNYKIVEGTVMNGVRLTEIPDAVAKKVVSIEGNRLNGGDGFCEIRLGNSEGFATIDVVNSAGQLDQGIYRFEGDLLIICFSSNGQPRPTNFDEMSEAISVLVLKRISD